RTGLRTPQMRSDEIRKHNGMDKTIPICWTTFRACPFCDGLYQTLDAEDKKRRNLSKKKMHIGIIKREYRPKQWN
ncbi:hypothetical protein CEXT_132851, partial [Caerostris extrusa]